MHQHDECPVRHLMNEGDRTLLDNLVRTASGSGNHYILGSLIVVTDTITDNSGQPVAASNVIGYTFDPSKNSATHQATPSGPNQWQFTFKADKPGLWRYRAETNSGVGEGAAEGYVYVDPSSF